MDRLSVLQRWRLELRPLAHTAAVRWVLRVTRFETDPTKAFALLLEARPDIPAEVWAGYDGARARLLAHIQGAELARVRA